MVGLAAGPRRAALNGKAPLAHAVRRLLCAAPLLVSAAAGAATQPPPREPQCGAVTGDPALAIHACTRLIEFGSLDRPDLAKAYYARGTEWANQGNHDRALPDFDLAIELDPKLAPAYYNRALSWSSKGESDRAIADYDIALKLRPATANALIGRAVEYTAKGDYRRALADYDQAIRLEPDSAAGYFGRGRVFFYTDDFMRAASDFYRTHQIDPSIYTALWLFLARKRADIPGEKTLAQEAGTSGSGPWPAPIVALYLGTAAPDAVMRAIPQLAAGRNRDLQCEAGFYVGQWHVLRGAREPAAKLLKEAEHTCPRTFLEHEGAVAELRRLQRKP